jgi:predicted dehydrogenase
MSEVRVAVVGTGALGRHHARILSTLEGVVLAGIADTNPEQGRQVAAQAGTKWVTDFRELISEVDAAVVAVPTSAHFPVAAELLRHGIDVLVEKPIAAGVDQARQLVSLAQARRAILQVGHVERFNPALTAARGHLAAPRYIRAERYSPYAFRSMDIGVVHDLMIHDIDLMLSLVQSEVERVEAVGSTIMGGHEDCVQARLTLTDGCLVDLSANRVSPVSRRTMQIWSDGICAELDLAGRTAILHRRSAALRDGPPPAERAARPGVSLDALKAQVFESLIETEHLRVAACDQLTEELKEFAECVRTRRTPRVDGVQATRAMEVADRILEDLAARNGSPGSDHIFTPFREPPAARKLAG